MSVRHVILPWNPLEVRGKERVRAFPSKIQVLNRTLVIRANKLDTKIMRQHVHTELYIRVLA